MGQKKIVKQFGLGQEDCNCGKFPRVSLRNDDPKRCAASKQAASLR
jgi:hypothetical protein